MQGPFKWLQYLNTYGIFDTVQPHVQGLAPLINLRGGLDKIETDDLAEIRSY